jgi:hypothetical protein
MRPPRLGTLLAVGACLILVPTSAFALPKIGGHGNGYSLCDEQALHLYAEGMKSGHDFGRNRIEDGKMLKSGRVVPEPHPCAWRDYLDAQLHPPATVAIASSVYAPPPATSSVAPGSGGLPACTYEDTDPTATNSSSSAYGIHQIIPSTAQAYDCDLTTVGGQESCAQAIYADVGTSAWVGC